jgi:ABC-type branched-subunit amino acid transport system substrate-binding protein
MKVPGFAHSSNANVRLPFGRGDSCRFIRSWRLSVLLCFAFVLRISAAQATNHDAAPFLRFRDVTLGYTGPDEDFTNLTEVRLGWFGPSDATNELAADMWWAANRAVQEANEQGGCSWNSELPRLPFRLVPRWAVDPWGTGVSQLSRMVYDERPLALIGSVDSASTHLAEQVVAKANLPLVSPIATDKSVTLAGVSWMFACAPSDAAIARVLVDDILARRADPSDKLVLLTCTDHESRMTAREVLKEFTQRGRLPDFRFDVQPGAQGVAQQLAALAESDPAAVLIIAGAEDAARLALAVRERLPPAKSLRPAVSRFPTGSDGPRRAGERGSGCLIFGSHAMGRTRFRELAGQAAEGVRFPLLFVPNAADTNVARFTACFAADHQHPPDYTTVFTYDATRLLIEAIRHAGPSRVRLREALTGLSPWAGLAGPISFDGTGQNVRTNICMGTIREGAVVLLEPRRSVRQTAARPPAP